MAKTDFLARLSGSLKGLSPDDLATRRHAAETAVSEATSRYQRAAYDAEANAPGAASRVVEAREALTLAQDRLRDVLAAQIEAQAVNSERERRKAIAGAERQDKATRTALGELTAAAKELETVIAAYATGWARYLKAAQAVQADAAQNPRVRGDIVQHFGFPERVRLEIARVAPSKVLPPGANEGAGHLSDKRTWKPLGQEVADFAASVLPRSK